MHASTPVAQPGPRRRDSPAAQASNGIGPRPAAAAPASSSATITTVEVTPPASTAHTPGPVPAPRRWYSRTCQAPPVTGPAGIILASPVEASTRPNTVRHRNRAPPAASSWRCRAAGQRHTLRGYGYTQPGQPQPAQVGGHGPRITGCARGTDRGGGHHTRCQPADGPALHGRRGIAPRAALSCPAPSPEDSTPTGTFG